MCVCGACARACGVRAFVRACVRSFVRLFVRSFVRSFVRYFVPSFLRACLCACVRVCVSACGMYSCSTGNTSTVHVICKSFKCKQIMEVLVYCRNNCQDKWPKQINRTD